MSKGCRIDGASEMLSATKTTTQIESATLSPVQCGCGTCGIRTAEQHSETASTCAGMAEAIVAHAVTEIASKTMLSCTQDGRCTARIEGRRIAVRYPRYSLILEVSTSV